MKRKWNPEFIGRKIVEVDEELFERRLEEVAEVFYDAICELHRNRSVEPKLKNSCDQQELEKVG
jgi:hypothetical protein